MINPEAAFKVVIEAHADEISWFVNYISPEGLIYVIRNGGSDQAIAPSKRVNIHTEKGIVKAVFGWPAIHTRLRSGDGKEPQPKVDNIFLDCGARSRKEVEELGIHVGCVVTFDDLFEELNYDYFICRAIDNRIGGFMIAEVARLLHENKQRLPFGLYIVNAVQEEVGLRGAEMIAKRIKPNVAIITDVTHDTTTPMINKNIEGEIKCGAGPSITYGPAVHNILRDLIIKTAKKEDIPTSCTPLAGARAQTRMRLLTRTTVPLRPSSPSPALHAHHRGDDQKGRRGKHHPPHLPDAAEHHTENQLPVPVTFW